MSNRIKISSIEDLQENPELAAIYAEFIRPSLRDFRTNNMQHALKMFFGLDYRSVDLFRAKRDFTMSGDFKDYRVFAKSIAGLRRVKKGEIIFVRSDTRESPAPEVQVVKEFDSVCEDDDKRIFRLTISQYSAMLRHVDEIRLE